MKNNLKRISILLIVFIVGAAIFWWANNKHGIIKNGIQSTVISKSDSLYKITYDSSSFDEINGNAILFNVNIKVDSVVLNKIIHSDTVPGIIANIHIKSISIKGLKSLQLLSGSSIDVDRVVLQSPQIWLNKISLSTSPSPKTVTNDSMELYKIILGHFDFISAKSIAINNASFNYRDTLQNRYFNIGSFSVLINNFNVDKAHDYKQLVAYFVKNTLLSVKGLSMVDKAKKSLFSLDSLYYNSSSGDLFFNGISQDKQKIKTLSFRGLNTKDFILNKRFNSRALNIENLVLEFNEKGTSPASSSSPKNNNDSIGLGVNNILSAVNVDTLLLNNAAVSIKNNGIETIHITGINVMLPHIQFDAVQVLLKNYLHVKSIDFSFKEATITPLNGLHKLLLSGILYKGNNKKLSIDKLNLSPRYSRDVAMQKNGKATDLFYVDAQKITVMDCNIFDVFLKNSIVASSIAGSMDFVIYNDKTWPSPPAMKYSDYPQQKIQQAKINIDIPFIKLTDCKIAYEEKSKVTKMVSQVPFYHVSATIKNVHNRQNLSQPLLVDVQAIFLNKADFVTHWTLPYNNIDGKFNINGTVGQMDLTATNPFAKGMGLVQVKDGKLHKMTFDIDGNKLETHGNVSALYDDVKVDMLKFNEGKDSLEKQGLKSFIGGLMLRKNHTNPNNIEFEYKPKMGDSFFGTSWASIFAGLKKVAL